MVVISRLLGDSVCRHIHYDALMYFPAAELVRTYVIHRSPQWCIGIITIILIMGKPPQTTALIAAARPKGAVHANTVGTGPTVSTTELRVTAPISKNGQE
jgi:hypothetical protein